MTMRRAALILSGLVAVAVVLLWWWPPPVPAWVGPAPDARLAPASTPTALVPPVARKFIATEANSTMAQTTADGLVVVPDIAAAARQLHAPAQSAEEDLHILETLLAFYRRAHGGANPGGGLNHEFVSALRGANPQRLAVLPPDLPGIDAQGQLLDRWGTAYFFHPVSRAVLEIRSAGPDRKFWTDDDVAPPSATPESGAEVTRR
jgi:hypothetical protein